MTNPANPGPDGAQKINIHNDVKEQVEKLAAPPGQDPLRQDAGLWNSVRKLHQGGFIDLVTHSWHYIPAWIRELCRQATSRPLENLPDEAFGYRINFADLHRMYMRQLHAKLITTAVTLQFETDNQKWNAEAQSLESNMRKYVQAVQDHEYMIKFSRQRRNPFLAPRERLHDDYFIMKKLDRRGGALIGGAFLIGPMWGLVLKREVYFYLGLTTGCVSAFGFLMAWYLDTVEAVFTATLAYSAVLMVFVGVSTQALEGFD